PSCPLALSSSLPSPPPPLHSFPTRRSSDLSDSQVGISVAAPTAQAAAALNTALADVVAEPPVQAVSLERLLEQAPLTSGLVVLTDRKSTRLNSSHVSISYAVFCLKKKRIHK